MLPCSGLKTATHRGELELLVKQKHPELWGLMDGEGAVLPFNPYVAVDLCSAWMAPSKARSESKH